jgi:hypothetical protein
MRGSKHNVTVASQPFGFGLSIKIEPTIYEEVASKIKQRLEGIDGVCGVSTISSLGVRVPNALFDLDVIKVQVEKCIKAVLEPKKAPSSNIQVKVSRDSVLSNYWDVETDFRHTSDELLAVLNGYFESVRFEHGGYNLKIKDNRKSEKKVRDQVKKVFDSFYGGIVPAEPFQASRDSRREIVDAFLVIATNYRFSETQQEELKERLETEVPGTYSGHFDEGGYNCHLLMANGYFDRDEAAAIVIGILEDYVASIGR